MKPKRNNKQKDILFIFISSFVVIVAWIGFNIYHIWATSTVSKDIQMELTPIDPRFDNQTMEQLKARKNINPLFESSASASTSQPTPTPQIVTNPTPIIPTPTTPEPTVQISVTPTPIPTDTPPVAPSGSPINIQGQ